ncbi:MAG: hypothetical protein ABI112_02680 [Terracoccus sp.]
MVGQHADLLRTACDGSWLGPGIPVLLAVVLYAVFHVVLERTPFGLATFAIGGSEEAVVLMGLKVRRNKVLLYVISAALAGVAGMLHDSTWNNVVSGGFLVVVVVLQRVLRYRRVT